jgi:UDP-N-acetyl-D-mannosaminuronate dehydrogenase
MIGEKHVSRKVVVIADHDEVVLLIDHDSFDFLGIAESATLVLDTRHRMPATPAVEYL